MKGERRVLANPLDCRAGRVTGELSSPLLTQLTTKLTGQAERCICVWQQGYFMLQMAKREKNCGRGRKGKSTEKKLRAGETPVVILTQPCATSEQHPVQLCVCVLHLNTNTVSPGETLHLLQLPEMAKAVERRPKVTVRKTKAICTHTHKQSPSILYMDAYKMLLLCVNVCCAAV